VLFSIKQEIKALQKYKYLHQARSQGGFGGQILPRQKIHQFPRVFERKNSKNFLV